MIAHLALAALLVVPVPPAPPSPPPPCVTRGQIQAVTVALAPTLIDTLAGHCGPLLVQRPFLTPQAAAFLERMRSDSAARPPGAFVALARGLGAPVPADADEKTVIGMVGEMAKGAVAKVDAPSCRNASVLIDSLAPLPPESLGGIITSILALSKVGKDGRGPSICPL